MNNKEWTMDEKETKVFFFKQKTAYEIGVRLVGSEMCIRDRIGLIADM